MASGMQFVLTGFDKSVGKTLNAIGDKLDSTGKKSGHFGRGLAKAGGLAAAGLAAGAAAAVAFGAKAAAAAMDDQQAAKILAQTLRNTTGARKKDIASVEDWISKTTLATGVADDDLRPALGTLLGVTHDATKAQKLLATAMDVSAATGKPLGTVTTALARAANGATDGLGRWGVNMKDASGKSVGFKEALKRLNEQFGGAQQTKTKSFAGQVQVLRNRFNETLETVGYKLLPVLTKLMGWVNAKAIPAIARFAKWFQANVLPAVKQVATTVATRLIPAVASLATWFQTKVLPTLMSVYQALWKALVPTVKALVETVQTNLVPALARVWEVLQRILPPLYQVVAWVLKLAFAILGKVLPILIKLVGFLLGKVLRVLANLVGWIATVIQWLGKLGPVFADVWGAISRWAGRVKDRWDGLVDFFKKLPGRIGGFFKGLVDLLTLPFRTAFNLIADLWNNTVGKLSFTIPGWVPGVGGKGFDVPDIPKMAKGGIVTRPTLALVGERGPEAVVPLSRGGFGGGNIYIDLRGSVGHDEIAIAKAVRSALGADRNRGNTLRLA